MPIKPQTVCKWLLFALAIAVPAGQAGAQSREQLIDRFRAACLAKFDHLRGKGQREVVQAHVRPCVQAGMKAHIRGELDGFRQRGTALIDAGKLAEAEATARAGIARARAIRREGLPPWPGGLALLGRIYSFQGKLQEAEQSTREALNIQQREGNTEAVANLSRLMGAILTSQGRHAEAEKLFAHSLAVLERSDPKSQQTGQTLLNFATFRIEQGRHLQAEPMASRALSIFEAQSQGSWTARAHLALGRAALGTGRFVEAEEQIKRALAVGEAAFGTQNWELSQILRYLGETYYRTGRLADSEPILVRAVDGFQSVGLKHRGTINAMRVLGSVRFELGNVSGAEAILREALQSAQQVGGTRGADNVSLTQLYLLLGQVAHRQGRLPEAEELINASLKTADQIGGESTFARSALIGLGRHMMGAGRLDEARPVLERALLLSEKIAADGLGVAAALRWLVELDLKSGRANDAQVKLERITSVLDARRAGARILAGDRNDEISPMLRWVALASARTAWALQQAGSDRAFAAAFPLAQYETQSTAAVAIAQMSGRFSAADDALGTLVRSGQDLLQRRQAIDEQLTQTLQEGPDAAAIRRPLRAELDTVAKELSTLGARISAEFPQYAALARPTPLAAEEVQKLLGPDEAVLSFLVGDTQSFVWAISRDSVAAQRLAIGRVALADKIERLRKGLDIAQLQAGAAKGSADLFDLRLAHELFADLFGPVRNQLAGKRNLLIVPSGPLTSLPFHLLVTEAPARPVTEVTQIPRYREASWIIKQHAVTILPSVASLKALRLMPKARPERKPLIGFGDPVFRGATVASAQPLLRTASIPRTRAYTSYWSGGEVDRKALSDGLDALPETADELRAVGKAVGAAAEDLHLGADASEATIKRSALAGYRIIYFATHGLIAGELKGLAEPALAFSTPQTASKLDDGLLTASEVAQLKLDADWVVLSACNTAAGNRVGAEALSGLARAFFYAGARSLLVSHWPVESRSAVGLSTGLFEALKRQPELGRAEALRQSMLAQMNDTGDVLNAHPAFWGPFAIVGEGAQ